MSTRITSIVAASPGEWVIYSTTVEGANGRDYPDGSELWAEPLRFYGLVEDVDDVEHVDHDRAGAEAERQADPAGGGVGACVNPLRSRVLLASRVTVRGTGGGTHTWLPHAQGPRLPFVRTRPSFAKNISAPLHRCSPTGATVGPRAPRLAHVPR